MDRDRSRSPLPPPGSVSVSRGPRLPVGPSIAQGTYNSVHDVSPRTVLRRSMKPFGHKPRQSAVRRTEHGLVALLSDLGLHPKVHAGLFDHEEAGGVAALLMQRYVPLNVFLRENDAYPHMQLLVDSLLSTLCHVADLGLCLTDIKPGNMVVDPRFAAAYVIDVAPDFAVFADGRLLSELFESYRGKASWVKRYMAAADKPCAQSRALSVYVMLLLLATHAIRLRTPRAEQFLRLLGLVLSRSCVPWDVLIGSSGALAAQLQLQLTHYFGLTLEDFFTSWTQSTVKTDRGPSPVVHPSCMEATVNGVRFDDHTSSCCCPDTKRQLRLASLDDEMDPCPAPAPDNFVVKGEKATRDDGSKIVVPRLRMHYSPPDASSARRSARHSAARTD
jgi:hypothetical protein